MKLAAMFTSSHRSLRRFVRHWQAMVNDLPPAVAGLVGGRQHRLLVLQRLLHLVEPLDVRHLEGHRLGAGVTHDQQREAVAGHVVGLGADGATAFAFHQIVGLNEPPQI
jgi:hypothetical protein